MDQLDRIVVDVKSSIVQGYYSARPDAPVARAPTFVHAIERMRGQGNAIVAELKPASPSEGALTGGNRIDFMISTFRAAGAAGYSVLTEPKHFGGSFSNLLRAQATGLPVLMKDFVISLRQLDAAAAHGASAVLLIVTLYERGHGQLDLNTMIDAAHARKLEVLLESASFEEYQLALSTQSDMIGINNRDLATLRVDLQRTVDILARAPKDRPVWSLSGIETPEQIRMLRRAGADAFLIGTHLMKSRNPGAELIALRRA